MNPYTPPVARCGPQMQKPSEMVVRVRLVWDAMLLFFTLFCLGFLGYEQWAGVRLVPLWQPAVATLMMLAAFVWPWKETPVGIVSE
jgi:hypothetical protein